MAKPAMLNLITVVIPVREISIRNEANSLLKVQQRVKERDARLDRTLKSIWAQTMGISVVNVIHDSFKGANFARNKGFNFVRTPFVLFSDDDIDWEPDAFENLYHELYTNPQASFSYGWYEMDGKKYCQYPFNPDLLRQKNYISTMSLIRREHFPGFDEKIKRLQDWDLWLTMLSQGRTGVYCDKKIFSTDVRDGITFGPDSLSWEEAERIVKRKHRL